MIWAARMAGTSLTTTFSYWVYLAGGDLLGFLLFRVLKIGSDSRFDTMRAHFFQFLGASS